MWKCLGNVLQSSLIYHHLILPHCELQHVLYDEKWSRSSWCHQIPSGWPHLLVIPGFICISGTRRINGKIWSTCLLPRFSSSTSWKIELDFKMHMAIVPTNVIFAAFRQMKNKIEQIRMRRFYTTFVLANSVLSIGVSCYWGWTVPMKPKEFEQMIDYMKQTNNTKGLDYALNHKSFYNFWPLPPCRFNHHLFTLIFLAVSTLSAFTSLVELCLSVCQITFVNWVFNKSTDTR